MLPFSLTVSGGGSRAISEIASRPGASRMLIEANVPYHCASFDYFVGDSVEKYCDEETARRVAMTAYRRAKYFAPQKEVAGVALLASLATDRPKRGGHRLHLALQTKNSTKSCSQLLKKDERTRDEEEDIAANLLLKIIADDLGWDELRPEESTLRSQLLTCVVKADNDYATLIGSEVSRIHKSSIFEGMHGEAPPTTPFAILPGSFNPPHQGHAAMRDLAEATLEIPVHYELSVRNADKPPLDFIEIARRLSQIRQQAGCLITAAGTFVEKVVLLRNAFPMAFSGHPIWFVVGADTISRVGQPRFYGSTSDAKLAIQQLSDLGARFLVFGREQDGEFVTLHTLLCAGVLPPELAPLCESIQEGQFREDICSTEMRQEVTDETLFSSAFLGKSEES